jgi:hypothetical protein
MARSTKKSRKKYIWRWLERTIGPSRGRGTSMEACTPPLMNVTWLMVHSMMS